MRWSTFGTLIKGSPALLIRGGEIDESATRREHMTVEDLQEDLRLHGRTELDGIGEARLERNGKMSLVPARSRPRIVEVQVEQGVQTVRIEIG